MCKKKHKINCKIYSSDMMFSDTKTEFCNFCENNFNCNNKNIEDVKNLYKKYKINFNLCSACIFLFNTETEMYNLYKNNIKFITTLIDNFADLC